MKISNMVLVNVWLWFLLTVQSWEPAGWEGVAARQNVSQGKLLACSLSLSHSERRSQQVAACWHCGTVVLWYCGTVVLWQSPHCGIQKTVKQTVGLQALGGQASSQPASWQSDWEIFSDHHGGWWWVRLHLQYIQRSDCLSLWSCFSPN